MQDTQWSIKVVEKLSRRELRCLYKGSALSHADSRLMREVLTWRVLLFADLVADPSAKEVAELLRTIGSITAVDVEQYSASWSWLKEQLLRGYFSGYANWSSDQWRDFKHRAVRGIRYKWILNTMISLMERESPFECLLQWIVFDEKVNFRSLDLTAAMVDAYCEDEENFRLFDYSKIPEDFIKLCGEVAARFELPLFPFRPKHGPGATAETDRRHSSWREKNPFLTYDDEIDAYCARRYVDAEGHHDRWFFGGRIERSNDVAHLVCVPKSMVKNRTISKEPVVRQWLQQDVFRALDDWFSSDPLLRHHIDLHDQVKSREMAQKGSESGAYATIDLSRASDTVTCTLIKLLFGGSWIEDAVMSTRSRYCIVPNREIPIELEKVAGMGNAVCFPLECLVFSLCCEYACRTTGIADTRRSYRVFGDDIVIATQAVDALLDILDRCGFTVNVDKSFTDTTAPVFREACGIWCLDGRDITPLRLSRRLTSITLLTMDAAPQAAGALAFCNESFRYGLLNLNRGIHAALKRQPWYPLVARLGYYPGCEETAHVPAPYLLTWCGNATQWQVPWSFGKHGKGSSLRDLQRDEYLVSVFSARPRTAPGDENDLFSYWVQTLNGDEAREKPLVFDRHFNTAGTSSFKWKRKWVNL